MGWTAITKPPGTPLSDKFARAMDEWTFWLNAYELEDDDDTAPYPIMREATDVMAKRIRRMLMLFYGWRQLEVCSADMVRLMMTVLPTMDMEDVKYTDALVKQCVDVVRRDPTRPCFNPGRPRCE